jgi:preprotein translocase subunit SecA
VEEILESMGLIKGGSLYDLQNIALIHHVNQALKAHKVFARDVDYIIKDRKVIIIDEFTGRMMEGRRYSEGLHQALEAKEGMPIQMENQTLASITFQNYFRMYDKLSGMTGTGKTEAAEFMDIYSLDVLQIPTNVPVARKDMDDEVYRTEREKIQAIITEIETCHKRQQPVLVGTVSIEKSEQLSQALEAQGVPHQVLNARYHEQEAFIIAQAGRPGAVTIATNMAGRGTDIKLGGNVDMRLQAEAPEDATPEQLADLEDRLREEVKRDTQIVKEAGGLFVIGTERHDSRRIDNQLRGRSGRQGDPGASKFYLSLQDELMRRFGSDRLEAMLVRLGLQEGEAITHPWVNKALERAQQKVEAYNFEIRKHLLKYDNVMNDQRKVIYEQRRELMQMDDPSELMLEMREDVLDELISRTIPENSYPDQWDVSTLHEECLRLFALDLPVSNWVAEEGIAEMEIRSRIASALENHIRAKEEKYTPELLRMAEKTLLMRLLDQSWKEHLLALDHLKQGIGLRGYAQRDPLNEYKQEAFHMFHSMLARVRENATSLLCHLELSSETRTALMEDEFDSLDDNTPLPDFASYFGPGVQPGSSEEHVQPRDTIGRNDPCPCGSGERYKHCHGKLS